MLFQRSNWAGYRSSGDEAIHRMKSKNREARPEAKDEITKPRQSNPKGYWGWFALLPFWRQQISVTGTVHFRIHRPSLLQCTEQVFWGGRVTRCHGRLDEKRAPHTIRKYFRRNVPLPHEPGSVGRKELCGFQPRRYYGCNTKAVAFEFQLAMYHMFLSQHLHC